MESNKKEIKYPYLPEGHSVSYVALSNQYMALAKEVARESNDQQQPTGAVIVSNGEVVAKASNMNPLKNKHLINLHKKYCIRHILHIPSGEKYWACPGCAKKESHAESRAAKQLKIKNTDQKFDLYLWGHWWCCDICWKNMLKLPIQNVFLLENSENLFNLKSKENILGKQFK